MNYVQGGPEAAPPFILTTAGAPPSLTCRPVHAPNPAHLVPITSAAVMPNLPSVPIPPAALNGIHFKSTAKAASKTSQKSTKTVAKSHPPPAPSNNTSQSSLSDYDLSNQCAECDYYSDKKDRMRRHVKTVHLREKPFSCQLCPYSGARKDKLKRHMETVHSDEKPFKCDFCNHVTNRKDKIKVHVESVHLKMRMPSKGSHKKKAKKDAATSTNVKDEMPTAVASAVAAAMHAAPHAPPVTQAPAPSNPPQPYFHIVAGDHFMAVAQPWKKLEKKNRIFIEFNYGAV